MAASRLPPATLTLKQFLRRQQVLLLYRRILRAIRQVPDDSDRKYLKDWARGEFKRNKSATEEDTIRMMITQGNIQLKELEKTLALAKSTDLKLIQESDLKDVAEILKNEKWIQYWTMPEERRMCQMVTCVSDLHCHGPPTCPTASRAHRTRQNSEHSSTG